MWPFSSYPERTVSDVADKTFDYIIVGGGTAGCLIAQRLSVAPTVSVLVLEKGRANLGMLSRIPLLGLLQRGVVSRQSEPNAHLLGRSVKLVAGELLGGTSRANSMVWKRGSPAQYDGWARDLGLENWTWRHVEPAFERVEKCIKRRQPADLGSMKYVEDVMERVGLGRQEGESIHATTSQGYGRIESTVDARGVRSSALTAWLDAGVVNERQRHLTVCTGAMATKLEFGGGRTRVDGVWVRPVSGGPEVLVRVHREIIICSGVLGSPQLLMLSGIGPKDHLTANAIPVVQDLPAVGANLSTHPLVPIMTELPTKHTFHVMQTVGALWHLLLWFVRGTGLLGSCGQHCAAFVHSATLNPSTLAVRSPRDDDEVVDLEIMVNPISTLIEHGVPGVPCLTWNAALVQPFTTGYVKLTSGTDPDAPLRIILPLLADERDSARMRMAVRFAMRLADEFSSSESDYPHPAPLAMAPGMELEHLDAVLDKSKSKKEKKKIRRAVPPQEGAWRTVTDEDIDEYVKRLVTGSYNPSSTCRMSRNKEDGVADQKLRVHGVPNLRIADASVLPRPATASTAAPVYMIGERCAEFVIEAWQGEQI
ncbi:alcohol oxidase [Thozetella sp. PMI_491]|nr:alcohol oxidase [Thozetella sp. PMI_491]